MDILMPQLGETVAEGKITTWFKAIGDAVKPGDNLFEIETDKVSMEVPATSSGVLAEIRVAAGEIAPVGAVVAVVADASAGATTRPAATAASPQASPGPAETPAIAPAASRGATPVMSPAPSTPVALEPFREVRTPARNFGPARLTSGSTVTPLARRRAAEAGIDLNHLTASGAPARIAARDVESAIAGGSGKMPVRAAPTSSGLSADRVKAYYAPGSNEEVPLDS